MKGLKKIITITILVLVTAGTSGTAGTIDPILEKLDISGFLRMRAWYFGSSVNIPGKFPPGGYEHTNYEDIFFRNRFFLKILPDLEIRTVFDISAKFGAGDFAIGSGGTNIVTRNVYAQFKPIKNIEISGGLMPFSLPGGYILARDATGITYKHDLLKKQVQLSASFIRAFDDADTSLDGSTDPDYADDNVWMITGKLSVVEGLTMDIYYAGEYDEFTDGTSDNRESNLHWLGFHNSYSVGDFVLKTVSIFNAGNIKDGATPSKTKINAVLWALEVEYTWGDLKLTLSHEGATGNPRKPDGENSFQDIKASHGYSLIGIDNSGGLAIRGSGESPLYGLYAQSLKAKYTLLDTVTMGLGYFHFRGMKSGASSERFGDEIDFTAEYRYREVLSFFLASGVFFPGDGYRTATGATDRGTIVEVMLGTKITY